MGVSGVKTYKACKFNIGVECDCQIGCHMCGWNPEVEKARKEFLRVNPPEYVWWRIYKPTLKDFIT